jgi:YHS domain-containing protein
MSLYMYDNINQGVFSDVAIEGYDPVAYHKTGGPVPGNASNAFRWKDATWLFSSTENIDAFKQNPDQYAPQFGGYCSFATSTGFSAKIDPNAWMIENGTLYLFNDLNFKQKFLSDKETNHRKAQSVWSKAKIKS